jgi:hypothetical protein
VFVNGGETIDSPVVNNGIHLDGVTQRAIFSIGPSVFFRPEISIIIDFMPDFGATDDIGAFLVDTTNGSRFLALKSNNANGNTIQVFLGQTLIFNILPSVYEDYWKQGERNCLIITGTTGNTIIELNGVQIGSSSTAWAPKEPTQLFVGSSYAGINRWDGIIYSVDIRKVTLNSNDRNHIRNNTTFTYNNNADLWANMATAIIDGSNNRTPDKSRYGKTILLGDGVGTGTPNFIDPGFLFDGSSHYMTLPAAPTGDFTIVTKRSEDIAPVFENDLTTRNKIATAGQFSGTLEFYGEWPFLLSPIQQVDLEYQLRGVR